MDLSVSNFALGTAPQVWLFSDFEGYNQLRSVGYPMYLSPVRQARLERIRQARMIHDGRHWRLFLFEGRTQFNFPEDNINGTLKKVYSPYNLCKLISQKSADLLFGDEPAVKVDDAIQQKNVAALVKRTRLHSLLAAQAAEAGVDGEVYIESVIENGEVYLKRADSADIFPEGLIQANGQYESYVKYNVRNIGTADKPQWMLLITRFVAGAILRELKQLDDKGFILPKVLTLNQWPQEDPASDPLEPETRTRLNRPSLVWIPNQLVRNIPVSDYDGLVELQDSLNAKNSQLARVLAKHSDPKLAAPAMTSDPEGNLRAQSDVYFFRDPSEVPRYITWNAELQHAIEDRREIRSQLLTLAEMSPILLGIKDGASSHSAFKSVRLEAINSITKAGRKAIIWKDAIDRILTLAQDMEQLIPGVRYDRKPVGIEMRDGLPIDSDALATEISTYRGCGAMSQENAVEIRLKDPALVAKELAALAKEAAAATPNILMNSAPGGGEPDENPMGLAEESAEEQTDAAVEIAA